MYILNMVLTDPMTSAQWSWAIGIRLYMSNKWFALHQSCFLVCFVGYSLPDIFIFFNGEKLEEYKLGNLFIRRIIVKMNDEIDYSTIYLDIFCWYLSFVGILIYLLSFFDGIFWFFEDILGNEKKNDECYM